MSKLAIITGASSGIGKEYAIQLADEGYDLLLNARTKANLEQVRDEISSTRDIQVELYAGDLTQLTVLDELCNVIRQREDFELLVNNAGFALPKSFLDLPVDKHQTMIDLHVTATMRLSYAAFEQLMEKNTGGIITVSSMASFIGSGMYSGTKNFQLQLSKRLAKEAKRAKKNVTIQALCPGFVRTNFHYTEEYKNIDVNKTIPSWLWMSTAFVVRDSLKNYKKGKAVVIPSFKYKLARFLARFSIISR